ncbi:hypothetical protein PVL29_012388 [Vitis rotundifolia]|uniref:Stigma-specific STIG1-like protein 1 n=1 Tax=Vitis rotundifolia TaxID=103349 RepID=A0AA38ZIW3_VITRO|nr:hypothetical protein PVL29_012388 [Vitis rotundifolia]
MAVAISTVAATPSESEELSSFHGNDRRFLAHTFREVMTCDKYPRVCRARGRPGPDCCKKKCVNVTMDRLNCGRCGKKCRYSEMCCEGQCVETLYNQRHCGRCNNRCKKGSYCVYGMCSYA